MTADLPSSDIYSAIQDAGEMNRQFMAQAVQDIDNLFGEGYAAKHPELIAGCVSSATLNYLGWQIGVCTAHLTESLRAGADAFSASVEPLSWAVEQHGNTVAKALGGLGKVAK